MKIYVYVIILLMLLQSTPVIAESYIYSSNGMVLKLSVSRGDSSIIVSYTLYNLSTESLFYSGNCLVTDNYSKTIFLDFGAILASRYISDVPLYLSKLAGKDSVTISQRQQVSSLEKPITVCFDCFMLSKLPRSKKRKALTKLKMLDGHKEVFKVDYSDYLNYYTDWFRLEVPPLR